MRWQFVLKLLVFFLPAILIVMLPFGVAAYVGEATPLNVVVAMQQRDEGALYYPTDIGIRAYAYKLLAVRRQQPDILVMGSSRATQFRSGFVQDEGASLYTAGCNHWGMEEQLAFLRQLDQENAPEIILLSIDLNWFLPGWEPTVSNLRDLDTEMPPSMWFSATRTMIRRLQDHTFTLSELLQRQPPNPHQTALGLLAMREGDGYRADGSLQWGTILNDRQRIIKGRAAGFDWIEEGENTYAWASEVDEEAVAQMAAFLERAQQLEIQVVGFTSPFMHSLYDAMMDSGNYTYMPRAVERLEALFAEYGVPFHDFSNAAWVGGSDAEMRDASHPSEGMTLRMYIELLKAHPDILGRYSDLELLTNILHNAADPFIVFEQ